VVKSCQQMIVRVTLLEQRVKVLETTVEHFNKKKQQSRARLQRGGVLQVQEALDLIQAREQANQEADAQYNQQGRKRAPPTCSNCGEKGHRRTTCKIVNNAS
jgi:mono/diheme cytochrome c family protein